MSKQATEQTTAAVAAVEQWADGLEALHARVGRRWPFATWDWKERAHRIDVAVVWRALDEPLRRAGAEDLHP